MAEILIIAIVVFLLFIIDNSYEDPLTRFLLLNSIIALIASSIIITLSSTIALILTIILFIINFGSYIVSVKRK